MKELSKGLDKEKISEISNIKMEPNWMHDYRLNSYEIFKSLDMPKWSPKININFDNITYYKKVYEDIKNSWNDVDSNDKTTFDEIGLLKAEKEHLSGVHVQLESEAMYHNMTMLYVEQRIRKISFLIR